MQFPGLGKYAALGSILAARASNVAAQNQNQMGPMYMNPMVPAAGEPVQGPTQNESIGALDKPLEAGAAPEVSQDPGDITLPPMPASSMLRDVAPKGNMAGLIANQNRKYRGL